MLPPLLASLGNCPDPDMALNNFEAYADKVLNPRSSTRSCGSPPGSWTW